MVAASDNDSATLRIGLDLVAQALLEKETIDGDLVNALVQQGLDGTTPAPVSITE